MMLMQYVPSFARAALLATVLVGCGGGDPASPQQGTMDLLVDITPRLPVSSPTEIGSGPSNGAAQQPSPTADYYKQQLLSLGINVSNVACIAGAVAPGGTVDGLAPVFAVFTVPTGSLQKLSAYPWYRAFDAASVTGEQFACSP